MICFSVNTFSDCRVKKSDIVWNFKITAEILFADESNIQTNRISMTPKRDSFLSLHLTSISSSVLRSVHSCSHFLFTNFLPNLLVTSELCGVLNFHHDLSIWVDDVYSLVTLAGECLPPLLTTGTEMPHSPEHQMLRIVHQPILDIINTTTPLGI